ncbi:FliC/FljB family flagellin [Bordetella genomosp. 11]|uniref:Flagellin n=1 Tax=Bordetella genomosp. 11 TaxID=1416808 RepID=A0A261UED7_9BORD|nr:FliC/FljB family flagellin [Bordetella genomosp. 11]OZI60284.1 flagellin [Bordetella genomosp. 11]
MAAVINTNYLSLVAQNNLNNSQSALGSAIERLSSGLRINSAKDDAAGQAIANRFTANVNGLTQAARNANDGISIAQTTEGALNEINNNLQRIRELTVQAQNGTNSSSDLSSIQAEIKQRLDEITRVSQQTQFNGVNVLASNQSLSIQVGANDSQTIDINLKQINASTLGLGTFDVTKTVDTTNITTTATTQLAPATVSVTDLSFTDTNTGSTWAVYVDDTDANKLYVSKDGGSTLYSATYNSATNSLQFDSSSSVAASATAAAGNDVHVGGGVIMHADDITGRTDANAAAEPELVLDSAGNYYVTLDGGSTYTSATVDASAGTVSYDSSTSLASAPTGVSSSLTEVDVPGTAVNVNLSGLSSSLVGSSPTLHALKDGSGYVVQGSDTDGNTVYYKANVNASTGAVSLGDKLSQDPLASLDQALQDVDSLRSDLGAVQNRLESTIANLNNTVNNLSDARSRIQDADYATEVSNMTRAQILQQAGTAVLAQANQVPQTVLSLLR